MVQHCGDREGQKLVPLVQRGWDGGTKGPTAGDVQQGAVDGGHPQVGGAGVEDHGEGLRGRSQADLPVVLSLLNNNTEKV